jgi:DNA-binding MarR family transcriptional regulator
MTVWLPRRLESRSLGVGAKFPKRLATFKMPPQPRSPAQLRGEQYKAMLDADPKLTRAELARRLGVSRAAVTQAVRRAR